ncbi:MBL fold metallo-hydrolase [Rhodovulum sp. DZ06]|uniref:MBL fold metallo-hydrolase n=1 Tax=Rhodovulum sp. DZ06 TaxID=3425126 RepID=UPI003D33F7F3
MQMNRRDALKITAAWAAAATFMPFAARAGGHGDMYEAEGGEIGIHPVDHASFVMTTPLGTIYNDPVGGAEKYADMPAADLVLITHEHGDHFNLDTLNGVVGEGTMLLTNPSVYEKLPEALKAKAQMIGNGETTEMMGVGIEAIPAYNLTEERKKFHPKGRDNGYVLTLAGMRIYIAGDTEDIPEMRALKDIDMAFVPMNLPYTMDPIAAAGGVAAFAPKVVYPYHYRDQDPKEFAAKLAELGAGSEVKYGAWYGEQHA